MAALASVVLRVERTLDKYKKEKTTPLSRCCLVNVEVRIDRGLFSNNLD